MKPHIICHMASSIDGRILPERWTPRGAHSHEMYEELHDRLGGGSWIVGRVTGQEFAKREVYPERPEAKFPRRAWLPRTDAEAYGIVLDAQGKIAWGRSDVGDDPIVVVLTKAVSDAHLAGLREDGVGYIFAGETHLDPHEVLAVLSTELGIDRLLIEGGGHLNGGFLRAGLIDEISLMLVPAIDGASGAPAVFDGSGASAPARLSIDTLALISHEVMDGGIVWLRYRVTPALTT
ncbi:RibD family protein [Sphingomonas sp. 2R-10]|uniref:dihydrofolate reductase family protein n=1 Tax=Sphingomonas sp. 2R-10 TaxID=3045148 RepID=UPI000F787BF7|nr:RibD family protein [Sphingomonas sp. 2R-10]MDJ0276216.1 RibD family protein [Sphingomonas sp. 2R-10]